MRMTVKYNNSYYFWVDTIVMHDEYDYTCAVLVSSNGNAFPVCIDKIEVVDDNYNYEKQKEREIDRLKWESALLCQRAELDAELSRHMRKQEVE